MAFKLTSAVSSNVGIHIKLILTVTVYLLSPSIPYGAVIQQRCSITTPLLRGLIARVCCAAVHSRCDRRPVGLSENSRSFQTSVGALLSRVGGCQTVSNKFLLFNCCVVPVHVVNVRSL